MSTSSVRCNPLARAKASTEVCAALLQATARVRSAMLHGNGPACRVLGRTDRHESVCGGGCVDVVMSAWRLVEEEFEKLPVRPDEPLRWAAWLAATRAFDLTLAVCTPEGAYRNPRRLRRAAPAYLREVLDEIDLELLCRAIMDLRSNSRRYDLADVASAAATSARSHGVLVEDEEAEGRLHRMWAMGARAEDRAGEFLARELLEAYYRQDVEPTDDPEGHAAVDTLMRHPADSAVLELTMLREGIRRELGTLGRWHHLTDTAKVEVLRTAVRGLREEPSDGLADPGEALALVDLLIDGPR